MSSARSGFRGVLLDWRGTLVVAPTVERLAAAALARLGRDTSTPAVEDVVARLAAADTTRVDSSFIDTDLDEHRDAYAAWFAEAGLDDELAGALYGCESDLTLDPFAADTGDLLRTLVDHGVRVGVLSDIHVDLRPVFAAHRLADGRTWADLVDAWALSYQTGVAKPDPAAFTTALRLLDLPARDVLMVGDRGGWDGAAADVGITTLVLPALTDPVQRRLHRVLDLAVPAWRPPTA